MGRTKQNKKQHFAKLYFCHSLEFGLCSKNYLYLLKKTNKLALVLKNLFFCQSMGKLKRHSIEGKTLKASIYQAKINVNTKNTPVLGVFLLIFNF